MDRKLYAALIAAGLTVSLAATAGLPPTPTTQNQVPKTASSQPPQVAPMPHTAPSPATANVPQPASGMPQPVTHAGQLGQKPPSPLPMHKAPQRSSVTLANVMLPGNITYEGAELALNGAGIHKAWWFFNKYVAALYLAQPTNAVAVAVGSNQPKVIALTMLTDMKKQDFVKSMEDSFQNNAQRMHDQNLMDQWNQFKTFFTDLKKHDKLMIGYIPGKGTSLTINGDNRGTIPGEAFEHAIMGVWLGSKPVDSGLKDKLMGSHS